MSVKHKARPRWMDKRNQRAQSRMNNGEIPARQLLRGCGSKISFPSKKIARAMARVLVEKHGYDPRGLSAYKCKVCGGWHIGHSRWAQEPVVVVHQDQFTTPESQEALHEMVGAAEEFILEKDIQAAAAAAGGK